MSSFQSTISAEQGRSALSTLLRSLLYLVAASLALSFVILGCTQEPQKLRYYFGFVNRTGHNLEAVRVYANKKLIGEPGNLVTSGVKTEGPVSFPIPSEAQLRWDENNVRQAVTADLRNVPKNFTDGTIYFLLKADHTVEVKALRLDDLDGNARIGE